MATTQYVALLRGINVGGKNLIKMAELKACLEKAGYQDVTTYIQSGNVLFSTDVKSTEKLTGDVERLLSKTFNYAFRVVLRSRKQMQHIVEHAPKGFGNDPARYRYYVIFLKEPLTAAEAMESMVLKEGVDEAYADDGVLYVASLLSRLTQSRLTAFPACRCTKT